jgi:hypothetical protein
MKRSMKKTNIRESERGRKIDCFYQEKERKRI